MYQKFIALALSLSLLSLFPYPSQANDSVQTLALSSGSALLMEQSTGNILYEENPHQALPPASVTKIMTILLVMEALDQGKASPDDIIIVSQTASAMGGSQVYLKEGETMPLWEMLKCVVVVSANDGSVALAEHLYGSEEAFVQKMNEKAQSLGMTQTTFQNCTGLPADDHLTTAYDIALMSRELMANYPQIQELSTIWMDSIRDGAFGLSNTNRLIYSYPDATGLKTGSTDEALYCLSATASRDGLDLIAVILQGPSSDQRFADATTLLNYGFSTFTLQEIYPSAPLAPIPVVLGQQDFLQPQIQDPTTLLLAKSDQDAITTQVTLLPQVEAPVTKGQQIGSLDIFLHGQLQQSTPILATTDIPKLTLWEIYSNLFQIALLSK